ncbi:DUF4011 domain-containing protein [Hoyosella sp. YIM 151337]|uniref:DUF4011 domain-containing protein n=1 Tax=Hoyosella sp. YIM 151337 TaxID=2992742 RepID=UPI00223686C1|nr:DUF4011 domain-containing protein [Hoyosella sp. YIM 151337]MCW4354299.1 DUF4011 domain-containing protein [Hoyosella sp. YIM 151337]
MAVFGFEAQVFENASFRAELSIPPAIFAALVYNRVPLVQMLRIENVGDTPLSAVTVTLGIHGPSGTLTGPWVQTVPVLTRGSARTWDTVHDLRLRAPDEVLRASAAFPVTYIAEVSAPGAETLHITVDSCVLACNEWTASPSVYEAICAFVHPKAAAVALVLRRAANILRAETGSEALDGYQLGPRRAALIGAAIYEALRMSQLSYEQSAPLDNNAHRIRTAPEALDERTGTGLDLVVTYSACLDSAGLRSLIFFSGGEAFGGFHLHDERLSDVTTTDTNSIMSLIQAGRVVPVDLKGVTMGGASATFAVAHQAAAQRLNDPLQIRGLVDVAYAHRMGIRPLPGTDSDLTPAASTESTGDAAGLLSLPTDLAAVLREAEDTENLQRRATSEDNAPDRILAWRRSLLDLSLRNPLLKLPSWRGVDCAIPDGLLALLDDVVHDGERLDLLPHDQLTRAQKRTGARTVDDVEPAIRAEELRRHRALRLRLPESSCRNRIRYLRYESERAQQETGANYLYLTLGSLVHPTATGDAHAPLFLLPIRIQGGAGNRAYSIVMDGDEIAAPNHCLVQWLRVRHNVRISALDDPPTDDAGIDITASLRAIREALVHYQLGFRVEETASIRILQFSTFQMWRDLVDNWRQFMRNPVVRHLVERPGESFSDPAGPGADVTVNESALQLPIPADGSQMRAIELAVRGRSFVLEGPPGTGKSQTIANLIAHAMQQGKTILFVAEKQAALDVVKRRLDDAGLADFYLDLHGRQQSLPAIREQLQSALNHRPAGDTGRLAATQAQYRARLANLSAYPLRVHGRNPAELSLWSAYEQRSGLGTGATATVPARYFSLSTTQLRTVQDAVAALGPAAESAQLRPHHRWRLSALRTLTPNSNVSGFLDAAASLEEARRIFDDLPADVAQALRSVTSPTQLALSAECATYAAAGLLPDPDHTIPAEAITAVEQFHSRHTPTLRYFSEQLFVDPDFDALAAAAENATRGIIGKKRRRRHLAARLNLYVPGGHKLDESTVLGAIAAAVRAREDAQELAYHTLHVPVGWFPANTNAVTELDAARRRAEASAVLHRELPDVWSWLRATGKGTLAAQIQQIGRAWTQWIDLLNTDDESVKAWRGDAHWADAWDRDGACWLGDLHEHGVLALQRWGQLLTLADILAGNGLTEFATDLLGGRFAPHEIELAFLRGVTAAAVVERTAAGRLEFFDHHAHAAEIETYHSLAADLRAGLPNTIGANVIQHRPHISRDSGGGLVRQLQRKRGGLRFRELLATYPSEILGLTPCFLMSPASVANFVDPAAVTFDLVVFDEASQIRVQEAIGAMGRGSAVVVVGDSRQMPPTSVMHASTTSDADADDVTAPVPEDLDSILAECVESGLHQEWLTWHYRSADEALIAFSNAHYYDGRLASLPSPGRGRDTGLEVRCVAGTFDRGARGTRTNRAEADAIVAEVTALAAATPQSIGVVTFNVQQRDLLLNLLDDSDDPHIQQALTRTDGESLFVKNLENVQGDERDIILFSLGYSRDPETGTLPLNFGPLTHSGGERRLNVAITRARRRIVLFSSFSARDIDLRRTNSVGLQHLRAYLDYASGDSPPSNGNSSGTDDISTMGRAIASRLRDRGLEVCHNHGLSTFTVDMAVRRAGSPRWEAAVLLDSPRWAGWPTVADRDGAPRLLSTIMEWPHVIRVWLPEWLIDPDGLIDRIAAALPRHDGHSAEDDDPGIKSTAVRRD